MRDTHRLLIAVQDVRLPAKRQCLCTYLTQPLFERGSIEHLGFDWSVSEIRGRLID
jgi:hypothetical protein